LRRASFLPQVLLEGDLCGITEGFRWSNWLGKNTSIPQQPKKQPSRGPISGTARMASPSSVKELCDPSIVEITNSKLPVLKPTAEIHDDPKLLSRTLARILKVSEAVDVLLEETAQRTDAVVTGQRTVESKTLLPHVSSLPGPLARWWRR
jgi:hypothetical protein